MKSNSPKPRSKRTPNSLSKIARWAIKKIPRTQRSQFMVRVKLTGLQIPNLTLSSSSQSVQNSQDSSSEANTSRYCPTQQAEEGAGSDGRVTNQRESFESWEMCEPDSKKSRSESDSDAAERSTSRRTRKPRRKKEVPLRKTLLKGKAKPVSPSCSGQTLNQSEQTPQTPRKRSRSSSCERPRQELSSPQKEELLVESRKRQRSDSCKESKGGAKECRSESSSASTGPSTSRTTGKHSAKKNRSQKKKLVRSKAKPVSPNSRGQTQEQTEQTPETQRSRSSERSSQEAPGPSTQSKKSSEEKELYKHFLLPSFQNKYKIQRSLKSRGCGTVYIGVRREDNLPVAVKRIPLDKIVWKDVPYHESPVPHEEDMLARLGAWPNAEENHVTPVLLEWFRADKDVLLVLERPEPCMDLIDHLNTLQCCMSEKNVKPMFRQLVDVTIDMMSRGVFHRDIKPGNILLNWDENNHSPRVRLIDFGCASIMDPHRDYRNPQGTVQYLALEVLKGKYKAYPSTVWQLGMALYVMLHSERPRNMTDRTHSSCQLQMWKGLSDDCIDLLTRLMDQNPDTRIPMDEIKEHPWLTETPREKLSEGGRERTRKGLRKRVRISEEPREKTRNRSRMGSRE